MKVSSFSSWRGKETIKSRFTKPQSHKEFDREGNMSKSWKPEDTEGKLHHSALAVAACHKRPPQQGPGGGLCP